MLVANSVKLKKTNRCLAELFWSRMPQGQHMQRQLLAIISTITPSLDSVALHSVAQACQEWKALTGMPGLQCTAV